MANPKILPTEKLKIIYIEKSMTIITTMRTNIIHT